MLSFVQRDLCCRSVNLLSSYRRVAIYLLAIINSSWSLCVSVKGLPFFVLLRGVDSCVVPVLPLPQRGCVSFAT
eukprot:m.353988 g.353988  ORF g.353988 m.353988 type:complete len:74 (+) comp16890_c0_seq1:77-298(+)